MANNSYEEQETTNPNHLLGKWLSSPAPGEEVVVSGLSGQFPNSHNVYGFRDNLFNKIEMVDGDDRRWKLDHPEIPQQTGKIYNIDKLDAGFFGLHYRQAASMDPLMKVILESAIEAVVDAGVNPIELEGTRTGVFVSVCWSDVAHEFFIKTTTLQQFPLTGTLKSLMANRISYILKLKGPSCNIDTACSSSANAMDTAFRAIRTGVCDKAIVSTCNLILHPGSTIQFFRLGVLSYDGHCRVFDQDAKGYVRAEAAASVFLQKSSDSRRIYAEIINIKVNSDGFKDSGITFPSIVAQRDLMCEIYNESGLIANDLSYLEAHGTGTQVGDIQEVEAIDLALAKYRKTPLLVGSVKSSIGHTEPCSGVCSLTKVILAMETGKITPNINLKKIKDGMKGFEEGRMLPVVELTDLKEENAIIGVNNFGFGGNNAHIILKRFYKNKKQIGFLEEDLPRLVCVSGRTSDAVLALLTNLENSKPDKDYIALLHHIHKVNVPGHLFRGFTILDKSGPLTSSCNLITQKLPFLYLFFGNFNTGIRNLGKDLLLIPIFESTMKRVGKILNTFNINIIETLVQKDSNPDENLLINVVVQLGIAAILTQIEVKFTVVYGDSVGKLIAAFYDNVISLDEVILATLDLTKIAPNKKIKNSVTNLLISNVKTDDVTIKQVSSNKEDWANGVKDSVIFNVSDLNLGEKSLNFTNAFQFLEILGRLYEQGFDFQMHKLYPEIEFPVNRGTSMISPLIKWNHQKIWKTFKFSQFPISKVEGASYSLSYFDEEIKFLEGHVIDGRNLLPAMKYLELVWQTFCDIHRVKIEDCPVVFENCRFLRATAFQKGKWLKLYVSIQPGTRCFEVLDNKVLVASGRISLLNNNNMVKNLPEIHLANDSTQILLHDEIYRELYLRGYNYSGLFKGLVKCNYEATSGLIRWKNNFTVFMDNMLQLSILQTDSRLLFVPVIINKIVIDPIKHLEIASNLKQDDTLLPVFANKANKIIRSGGIEISGLKGKSIARKPQQLKPVLEKYEFVPNICSLKITQIVRVNTQIILENSMENNFKAVEVIDDFTKSDTEFLLPLVCQALDDLPLINPILTISTKLPTDDIPGIIVENVPLTSDSNLLLIVGSNLLERPSTLTLAVSALNTKGFVLSRENLDFDWNLTGQEAALELFTEYTTATEKLILLRKRDTQTLKTKLIELDNSLDWLSSIQDALKEEKTNILVYANNRQPSGILGLVNCIRREPGGSKVKCFFTFDKDFDFDLEQYSQKTEMSFNVFQNYTRGTYRHFLLEDNKEITTDSYFVNNTIKGDLSSLKWFSASLNPKTPIPNDKSFIYVYYSSVNFKDIMLGSGRIGVEIMTSKRMDQECVLGFEYSGKDLSGRRVSGVINKKAISSMLIGDTNLLWEVPSHWTMEDAATVPAVYSTVIYALLMVAKLQRGSSILIHSAAGGVGLAAINVCRHYGCKIFVTVGTQEKTDYIKQQFPEIDDDHIGNSRDLSFEEMIKRDTKGRGVDIVLNSLAEEKLKASVRCLSHGGHFLEIGKFDLANDNSLELLCIEKEINYHGIMLDQIYLSSEEIKKQLHDIVEEGVRIGFIKPLPRVIFEKEEVEEAFRYMTKGKHIGKVLIKIRDEDEEIDLPKKTFKAMPRFDCDVVKSYVIIGGLGGIGLELADWLVLRGGKKIILSSRNGIQTGYQTQRIEIWRSYGVTVQIDTNDVTTEEGCIKLINEAISLGPVDAVFNLAAILQDALIEDQTEEMFEKVLAPKAMVTRFMDVVTRRLCPQLRYFVIFSSVSCGRGNIGQTNYGMANSIMERICETRKSEGLPALAIQWGAIGDVGLVAKMQKENKELVIGGTLQQKISNCFEVLDRFLTQDNPIVSSMLVAIKNNRSLGIVSAAEAVASILGINDIKTVSQHATLPELGMDSMMGTEVLQVLEKDFDIYITVKEIRNLTFAKLTQLEAEKKEIDSKTKIDHGANYLVQFVPDNRMADASPLLKMQSKNEGDVPTVFVLPGMEGVLKPLEAFVKDFKANVFGIQYSYKNPEDSVEDLARNTLQHMERYLSKDHTFTIMAYSLGVDVGLEIGHLLEAKGYKGRLLAIDGSPSYLKLSVKNLLPTDNEAQFETILLQKLLQNLLPVEILQKNKENFFKCQNFAERVNYGFSLIPPEMVKKFNFDTQGAVILYKRLQAMLKYEFTHKKLESLVHLVKAKIPMVADEEDYGLSKICANLVVVTTLDGNHGNIINQEQLIEIVNKFIE